MSDVQTEVEVKVVWDGIDYSGHIDFLCNGGNLIIDLKTGRGETDYRPQLIEYAALLILRLPFAGVGGGSKTIAIINSTTGTVWYETLTHEDIIAEFDRIHKKIKNWDGQYSVGDWCKYCPARDFCPANITKINNSLELLGQPGMVGTVDVRRLVEVYPLIGQMESRLKFLKDFVRDQVCLAGGKIETESGTLELQQVNRAEVIPKECAEFVSSWIDRENFYDILKVNIGDLERAMLDFFKGADPKDIDEGWVEPVYKLLSNGDPELNDDGKPIKVGEKCYRQGEPSLTKIDAKGNLKNVSQDEFKKWLRRKLQSLDALVTTTTQKLTFKASKPKEIEA
jgi:hypothetical protein